MNQNYLSTLPSSCPTQDADIQKLKHLLHQLIQKSSQPSNWLLRQSQYQHQISQMERKILELSGRLAQLQNEHFEVYKQMQYEKDLRIKQRQQVQKRLKKAQELSADRDFWSTPEKEIHLTQSKQNKSISPSNISPLPYFADIKRNETLIDQLVELQQSKVSSDQIHRLNSYLVQNTTALKLLTEKCKYLIKLREMNSSNLTQQFEVLKKTKELVSSRKIADQAKTVLYKSRKAYFQSDHSSSEIQAQSNNLGAKDQ